MSISVSKPACANLLLAATFCAALPARAADTRELISNAYRTISTAYNSIDPQGMIAFLAPTCTVIDEKGNVVSLDRDAQLQAAKFAVRTQPNTKFIRREVFGIKQLITSRDETTVKGTIIQELLSTDKAGTVVYVRFSWDFEDEWHRMAEGWRCFKSHQTSPTAKNFAAQPSPMLMGMVANMRLSNEMLRNFNRANNYSYCMNSNANQRYDYETRKGYCSN